MRLHNILYLLYLKNSKLQCENWRYGQVVRQWIANPLSPVRIWVPPRYILLKCCFFITELVISFSCVYLQGDVVELVDTTDLKSVA